MALKKIESREYKVMVDPRIFDILPVGLKFLKNELALIAKTVGHVKLKKSFKLDQSSTIRFLDTKDFFLANLNYIFRAKQPSEPNAKIEYTLKYRTGDRYLSAYRQLSTAAGTKGKKKFEEDIGADKKNSFISKYSQSVSLKSKNSVVPGNFKEAASFFTNFKQLPVDHKSINITTELLTVNDYVPREQVFAGIELQLPDNVLATVAIILWTDPLNHSVDCAELSFRYASAREKYTSATVKSAYDYFEAIQEQNWCHLEYLGKTSFAYAKSQAQNSTVSIKIPVSF